MTFRNLVVSGGPLHDFSATTAALVALAGEEGIESEVPPEPGLALDRVPEPGWDLVTVNALLWTMPAERHAPLRETWSFSLADRQAEALLGHVERGGGLLACHAAPICFDGDARWRSLLGATWSWDRSHHPPLGPARVATTREGARHPITGGTEPFDVVDEVYADLDADPDLVPLLTSPVGQDDQPILWTRTVGRGRVVVSLLGHQADTYGRSAFASVVRSALRWLVADDQELR